MEAGKSVPQERFGMNGKNMIWRIEAYISMEADAFGEASIQHWMIILISLYSMEEEVSQLKKSYVIIDLLK